METSIILAGKRKVSCVTGVSVLRGGRGKDSGTDSLLLGRGWIIPNKPNSNPLGVRFRNPRFWHVPLGLRILTEGGVGLAKDRGSLVTGNLTDTDFFTSPGGRRPCSCEAHR